MSEKLNNNSERVPNDNSAGAMEYPAFDPKAAEEARRQAIAEYESTHPDVVQDVEKARFMARVEDPYRTQAIAKRREASEYQDKADELYIEKEQLAALNDWEASTKVGSKWLHNQAQSRIKKLDADKFEERADDAGRMAGDIYDSSREQ